MDSSEGAVRKVKKERPASKGKGKSLTKRFWLATPKHTAAFLSALCLLTPWSAKAEQFEGHEIRVIKNKFFTKRMRLELGVGLGGSMNQSFHNSYLFQGNLGFHFSEQFGLHGEYTYSYTRNKSECETLGSDKFLIAPVLNVLDSSYGGYLSYTPIYGKYQLGSGDVLYFDWFFLAGAGLATNRVLEGGVPDSKGDDGQDLGCGKLETKVTASGSNLQVNFGTGQRYFLSESLAFVWNLKFLMYQPAEEGKTLIGDGVKNVILTLGVGYFL
jgi:outer membrane beta-barrel protein